MTNQKYIYVSTTDGEYELYARSGYMCWPRNLAKMTPYQKSNSVDKQAENIGDIVYLVIGAGVKNGVKDESLKEKLIASPMLTHQCVIESIHSYPLSSYSFLADQYKNLSKPQNHIYNIPLDLIDLMIQLKTFMGKPMTANDLNELKTASLLQEVICELRTANKIEYVKAYLEPENQDYYLEEGTGFFSVATQTSLSALPPAVPRSNLPRYFPDKKSLALITEGLGQKGIANPEKFVAKLTTWTHDEYVKVKLIKELWRPLGSFELSQGISARQISDADSDVLVSAVVKAASNEINDNPLTISEGSGYMDKNVIFYGPPGTGKTYHVVDQSLAIIDQEKFGDLINKPEKRGEAVTTFNELCANGQIEVCTFHQSYSYEEFMEGWRSKETGGFSLEDGVFKRICNAARASSHRPDNAFHLDEGQVEFYKLSLGNASDDPDVYDYCINNDVVAIGWGEDVDFTKCGDTKEDIAKCYHNTYPPDKFPDQNPFNIQAIHYFRNLIKVGDIVVVSDGNKKARAIGKIEGEYVFNPDASIRYLQFRKVKWLVKDLSIPVNQIMKKQFSQMTIYHLTKADLNIDNIKQLLEGWGDKGPKNYVLVIDEINRGNISKILGELVTLIEEDKRIGMPGETMVSLPYSGESFGVPANLYIIGTMNTADRSIALMDTALRRRFSFIEMMPEPEVLSENVQGINLQEFLRVINERVEFLYDRDHTIGHAYFMQPNLSLKALQEIMCKRIIPLLQEYFYEDWDKIALVLGGAGAVDDHSFFISKTQLQAQKIFMKGTDQNLGDRYRYRINPNPGIKAFQRLVGTETTGSESE